MSGKASFDSSHNIQAHDSTPVYSVRNDSEPFTASRCQMHRCSHGHAHAASFGTCSIATTLLELKFLEHRNGLLQQNEKYFEKLTIRDIGTQTLAAVGAGSDTVAAGIQAFIYHMIRHPDAWDQAHDEIKAAMQDGLCNDSVVSFADSQQLRYITHSAGLTGADCEQQIPASMCE
jgi:hypothetical protein